MFCSLEVFRRNLLDNIVRDDFACCGFFIKEIVFRRILEAYEVGQSRSAEECDDAADDFTGKRARIRRAVGIDDCEPARKTGVYEILGTEEACDNRTDCACDTASDERLFQS